MNLRLYIYAAVLAAFGLTSQSLVAQAPRGASGGQLPDAPGRDTVQRLCGTCHSSNLVVGRGMTRDEWSETVQSMISRGAKGSPEEFAQVIDYLAKNFPSKPAAGAAPSSPRRGGGFSSGPKDKQIVDAAAADRGSAMYNKDCASCHGPKARGTERGVDLVRSVLVLHDRYGSTIGPFLQKGHPTQSNTARAQLTKAQVEDLSHFLHQQLNNTLRGGPYNKILNVLTGDASSGAAYFNGPGGCSGCHSPTGDLAGIARKYDPPTLQQRLLFPRTVGFGRGAPAPSKPVTVTVTAPGQPPVTGVLDKLDDFSVSLRDSSGEYHSWDRTAGLTVEKHDPYAAHIQLLDKYTDKNIHDLVAYLETLK